MKSLAALSAVAVTLVSPPFARSSVAQGLIEHASRGSVAIDSVRPHWPIVREPSGSWGAIGEAVARNSGADSVAVRSISFTILDQEDRPLLRHVFDTPETVSTVLLVSGAGPSGAPRWKPAGTTVLDPGDTGVAFLAALTAGPQPPAQARVTMRFDRAPSRTVHVPLRPFIPPQEMGWPLRLDGQLWAAINTAGTAPHWLGGTVLSERGLFNAQRFAIDLVRIDMNGETHMPSVLGKEGYYAWNEDIVSAGSGRVVAVVSDQRDHEIGEAASPTEHPAGNLVVIQHAPRLFSVYAHMQRATATVNVGDRVERGQIIGRIGNSGDSSQPHLHIHFTDEWPESTNPIETYVLSQGVPAVFWGAQVFRNGRFLELNGATPLEGDIIVSGDLFAR
jgi:hypothetical protein